MDWFSVVIAVLSAGLAFVIAALIVEKDMARRTTALSIGFIFFIVINLLIKEVIFPVLMPVSLEEKISSNLDAIPAMASIKKYEPHMYNSLVSDLTKAINEKRSKQQIKAMLLQKFSVLLKARMKYASDEALINRARVIVEEMNVLQEAGSDLCFHYLFPQIKGGADEASVFSSRLIEKDLETLDEIIKSSNQIRPMPDDSDVAPFINPIFNSWQHKFGENFSMISNPAGSNVDKVKVCEMTKYLYKRMLQLPPEKSALALRWLFYQI